MTAPPAVRPLVAADLAAADRIMRLAFGTFLKLPDPMAFLGDGDFVHGRFGAMPAGAFAIDVDGQLAATNFVTRWGSVGFFGPLTVRPDLWDQALGSVLVAKAVELFEAWGVRHAGLYTFANSPKHLGLYQKHGFWPQALNPSMWKRVRKAAAGATFTALSSLGDAERAEATRACRDLTSSIYEGLDVTVEIESVRAQALGETILVHDDAGLAAFAVCHAGPRTEAGSGALYAKFAAARAEASFETLLRGCEAYAASRGLLRLVAGVNTARHEAYSSMLRSGFRIDSVGVSMIRGDEVGYRRKGVFVIDDWR
jgi:GNAT superfamily N-acetyltransferase